MEIIIKTKMGKKVNTSYYRKIIFEFFYNDKKYIFWFNLNCSGKFLDDIEPYNEEKGCLGGRDGGFILPDDLKNWIKWYLRFIIKDISKKEIDSISKDIITTFDNILKENNIKIRKCWEDRE